jgi:hypothetical protein
MRVGFQEISSSATPLNLRLLRCHNSATSCCAKYSVCVHALSLSLFLSFLSDGGGGGKGTAASCVAFARTFDYLPRCSEHATRMLLKRLGGHLQEPVCCFSRDWRFWTPQGGLAWARKGKFRSQRITKTHTSKGSQATQAPLQEKDMCKQSHQSTMHAPALDI